MTQQGIQCSIGGFSGGMITLFSALDAETGVLTIAASGRLLKTRRQDCIVISNLRDLECDFVFTDAMIREAIDAWNIIRSDTVDSGHSRLVFADRVRAANPASMIEAHGLDERGRQYRLAENVGNESVAVLATCLWTLKANTRESVLDTADFLVANLMRGQAVTVSGIPPHEITPVFVHGYQVDQRAAGAYWNQRDG